MLSHADRIQQWQTSIPQTRSSKGWGGRMADILQAGNSNQNISMNISLSGTNIFQVGESATEYAIRAAAGGSVGINVYERSSGLDQLLQAFAKSCETGIFDCIDWRRASMNDLFIELLFPNRLKTAILSPLLLSYTFLDKLILKAVKLFCSMDFS